MRRQKVSLRAPRANEPLGDFPRFLLLPSLTLFRLTRDGHEPWWFSSSLEGRFDLQAPEGTCYFASDDLGAILEVLGPDLLPGGCAPASLLRGRHLRELFVPRRCRLADCLVDRASRWVTAELSTITPYALPQAWARALRSAGFDGLRYSPRHSTSRRRWSCAIFGRSGERRGWRRSRPIALSAEHRDRLRRRCGIVLFDVPSDDALLFAP